MIDIKWLVTVIVALLVIGGYVWRTSAREAKQNANIGELKGEVTTMLSWKKPSEVCALHFDQTRKDVESQKVKLSDQIERHIKTEKDIIELKSTTSATLETVKFIKEHLMATGNGAV